MNTITLVGDLHVLPHISPRIKDVFERRLSWRSMNTCGLAIEEMFNIYKFGQHKDSYYFLNGMDITDWFAYTGDVIAFQCTMPNDPTLLRLLHNMIDVICIDYCYSSTNISAIKTKETQNV